MTDYEKWKDWLDQWGIKYKEEVYDSPFHKEVPGTLFHRKELYIGNATSIIFDLDENFASLNTYDY